jgi:choline dehydrogenase-like flavoprotein
MTTQPDERFPDDDLPEGAVVDGECILHATDDDADFVIVGSGAAGAVAAYVLAEAGWRVAILEEGPWVKTRDLVEEVGHSFATLMRDFGLQVLKWRAYMPMLQGRCVGGSTLVNSAIAWRTPEDVIDDWRKRFGVDVPMAELDACFDVLERDLSVSEVRDEVLGDNNGMFIDAAHGRGIAAHPMRRYDKGCEGSGLCLTGCRKAKKQGMSVTYVPWALRARRGVLVAASTVQTPGVLRRSGVRAAALGKHFQAHPGLALGALFDRPVNMSFGATQGAQSTHFRKSDRFKLETISMPPELAAARVPGVGADLLGRLKQLGYAAVWCAQIRAEAEGTVKTGWDGRDVVDFTMNEADMRCARKAAVTIAQLLFDAGAREVWPGIYGLPSVLTSPDQIRLIEEASLDPQAYGCVVSHLFGAARMGPDPRASVCGTDFQVHGVEGLYVVDSSVFPTNLGVNPQHSIMGLSRFASLRIAERARAVDA